VIPIASISDVAWPSARKVFKVSVMHFSTDATNSFGSCSCHLRIDKRFGLASEVDISDILDRSAYRNVP
jgi:hypothetical protein